MSRVTALPVSSGRIPAAGHAGRGSPPARTKHSARLPDDVAEPPRVRDIPAEDGAATISSGQPVGRREHGVAQGADDIPRAIDEQQADEVLSRAALRVLAVTENPFQR